jgi:hypothetical protein
MRKVKTSCRQNFVPTKLRADMKLSASITQKVSHNFHKAKIKMPQTRHWCFTLNNWTAADDDKLKALGPTISYLVYGYETSESGTPHLQGYAVFPNVKRFSEAQDLLPVGCHLEAKRGSPEQAADYCKKDGVFTEFGSRPLGRRGCTQFDYFVEWVVSRTNELGSVPSEREIANKFPKLWLRNERKLRHLAVHLTPPPALMDGATLRCWQRNLRDALVADPKDDRSIMFIVDQEGGKGKSFFQRYMMTYHPSETQLMSIGKRDDVAHAIDQSKSIFLFNIPRGGIEYLNYTILEQIKDRVVFSPKYDSGTKVLMRNPHVVVFCNEIPDLTKMTEDRYDIFEEFDMSTIEEEEEKAEVITSNI